jgi:hypothetical protein
MTTRSGYKIVTADMTSPRDQSKLSGATKWAIGVEQRLPRGAAPQMCMQGFHYCPRAGDCLRYVTWTRGCRLLRVNVPDNGRVVSDGSKCCADALVAIEDVTSQAAPLFNDRTGDGGDDSALTRSMGVLPDGRAVNVVRGPDGYRRKVFWTDPLTGTFLRQDGPDAAIVVDAAVRLEPQTKEWLAAKTLLDRVEPWERDPSSAS